MNDLGKEFKAFLLRGNVVDLAVGVVIGTAFGAVVTALVTDLIMPIVGIPGKLNFAQESFAIHGSEFMYGAFITAVINFVLIAGAVFFFIVKPINHLMARRKTEVEPLTTTKECPECLSSIPVAAKRCAFCTASLSNA